MLQYSIQLQECLTSYQLQNPITLICLGIFPHDRQSSFGCSRSLQYRPYQFGFTMLHRPAAKDEGEEDKQAASLGQMDLKSWKHLDLPSTCPIILSNNGGLARWLEVREGRGTFLKWASNRASTGYIPEKCPRWPASRWHKVKTAPGARLGCQVIAVFHGGQA